MSSSYKWIFSDAYLGKNPDTHSYETMCNLYFKQLNTNTELDNDKYIEINGGNLSGYKISEYKDIAYIDLNSVHGPDSSFTLEFNVTELDQIDTTKAINYLTFGYQVRGKSGVTLTVGRPQYSSNVVIGTITESSTAKAVVYDSNFPVEPNTQYNYTLTYNNFATDEEKIKLFRGPYLISTSSNFQIQNYSIVDRKLFLGSSAWTNEPSWSNVFDLSINIVFNDYIKFHTNRVIDKAFIPDSPFYPIHYSFENVTNATRNSHQIAVKDDFVQIKFHSTKDVPTNNVFMNIDGLSNNIIIQTNVENPFILSNGSNTVMYTYQFQVTDSWPNDGLLSYGLDMYGNITVSNIFPEFTKNIYIDNTIPTLAYTFNPPSHNNVSFTITQITDAYLDVMINQTPFEYYTVNFYASNNVHVRSTVVNNPNINQSYFVENLDDETIYTLYATITDRANNTTERILPSNGSEIIETVDITAPVIQYLNTATITNNAEKRPGIKVTTSTYDTAAKLTVNTHNYTVYISILDENISDINIVQSKLTANNLFQQSKTNYTAETIEQEMLKYYDTNNVKKDIVTEKTFYIYCFVIDNAASPNKHFTKTSHFINNTLTLNNIVSNFSTNDIAQLNNTITLTFESEFKLYNKSQFAITMMGDTVTNATSTNGLNWTATNIVKNTNSSGKILFSVTQTPDIDSTSSFNQTNHTDSLYIQKENPVFKTGVNNTLSTGLTSLTVTNIQNYIDDFTINSNNNLFCLDLHVFDENNGIFYSTHSKSDMTSIQYIYIEDSYPTFTNVVLTKNKASMTLENAIKTLLDNVNYTAFSSDETKYTFYEYSFEFNNILSYYTVYFATSPGRNVWVKNRDYVRKVYNNISELPSVFTFPNLKENKPYQVRASISNLFAESSDQIIGSITTQKDIPIIYIDTTSIQIHHSTFYPVVQINTVSSATENTTAYNLYIRLTDFNITDPSTIKSFMLSTPTINNSLIGAPSSVSLLNYFQPFGYISNFYTGSSSSYTETQIIPSTTKTYYLYAMIDDTATEPVFDKKTVTFDFTFTEAVLQNTSYDYFVRNGDIVRMSWTTTYVSQVSDFSNVKIFGVNATPTSANGRDWTAQVTIVDGTANHSVSYLGTPLIINTSNVLYDNAAPTFNININTISDNSFIVNLESFGADTYTNQSVPLGINTNYTVEFTLTKTEDNSVLNYLFTKDYSNLITNNYTLSGLEEAKDYIISCKLTDPANNETNVLYDNGNIVQTSDVTVPIINSLTSDIISDNIKVPGFRVIVETLDNNDHTVYLSIFNYELTGTNEYKKGVITMNYLSTDFYTTINSNIITTKEFYKYFKQGDSTQYEIRTEETYYIYCIAVDIDGNIVISNNVRTIDNTLYNQSVFTNFYKNDIAEIGTEISISFQSDYRLFTDQLQVTMMGDSITPLSSDGFTWIAVNTVTNAHTSGKMTFSVSQTPDIGISTSSFNDTTLDAVYIQKENPSFFTLPVDNNIHNISVSLNANTKYIFTPSVTSFVRGHTYIFDNTGASTNNIHPLRFTSSSTHPGMDSQSILFKDDVNHIIVVTITDSTPGPIFAHCGVHNSDMGSVVNVVSGIPIVEETKITFGSVTNEIVVSNIGTNINDFTINSNNDLVKLTVELGGQILTNTYNNKSEIPSSFTFSNLTENTQYEVKASISNLFAESVNIVLGNANTSFDLPSITIDANVSSFNDEPVVQLLTTSKVTENTSAFDIYVEVTDFLFTDNTEVSSFVTSSATAKLTNEPVGADIDYVSKLASTRLSTYWSRNGAAFVNNNLVPSTTTQYYVYAMIDDHAHIIHNKANVTFDFTVSYASLSNTSYPYFVRNNDVVNMSWNTTFKSLASDFTNIKIFNQTPETAPTTTNYLDWSTSVTIPSTGIKTHNITVSLNENTKYIFTPSITSFIKGHTYIFDNTGPGSQSHPLRFTNSSSYPGGTVLFQNDSTHIILVTITNTTPSPIYAHCKNHQNMGTIVNGQSGISVVDDTSLIQHSITYLNTNLTVNSDNVLFDNAAPTFDIKLDSFTETSFNFKLTNIGYDVYSNQVIPISGINNTYNVLFKAKHTDISLSIERSFNNISYDNLILNTFTLDNLIEGNAYSIEATLTDPASNLITILYNSGNLIKTKDNTIPVITNLNTSTLHISSTTSVTVNNIQAYDLHNNFSIYTGFFETNEITFDLQLFQLLKDNLSSKAVIYQQNIQSTSNYVSLNGLYEKVWSYNGIVWTENNLQYNRKYYIYIGVEDVEGNINLNNGSVYQTVIMNDGPVTKQVYYNPSTNSFIEQQPIIQGIIKDAYCSLVFQYVVNSDPYINSESYVGYDVSGNNNHIYLNATDPAITPLEDTIINDYSVNLGKITEITFDNVLSIANNDGFTFITNVKNINLTYEPVTILKNSSNNFLSLSKDGVNITTDNSIFFPVQLSTDKWNSIAVSTYNNTIKVIINGTEIVPTTETNTNYDPTQAIGKLSIPNQNNILIDGIIVFNNFINDSIFQLITIISDFKIGLDFEEPLITNYNVTYSNNIFYLNDIPNPELILNSNNSYIFYQTSSNNIPFILSESGIFPVPDTDNLNVSYYVDDILLGNNPFEYSTKFSENSKVILHTDHITDLFYHSTIYSVLPTKITVNQSLHLGIKNNANTSLEAQPVYYNNPTFTTDAKVGDYAMVFDSKEKTKLEFYNFTLDANFLTMSAWVKTDYTKQSNNPIITQFGVFEYGIDNIGKSYIKLLNNDTSANYVTVEDVFFDNTSIKLSGLEFSGVPDPVYVYALATLDKYDKLTIMDMMDKNKLKEEIFYQSMTTGSILSEIKLNKVITSSDELYDANIVNQAFVYLSVRESSSKFKIGIVNQFHEFRLSYSNNIPRINITYFDNVQNEDTQTLQLSGTISSSTANIDKLYVFAFLTNSINLVDSFELTNNLINTFINSVSFVNNFNANVASGAIYLNDIDIPKKTIGYLTNATVNKAFNSITDATNLSSVYANSNYAGIMVGIDSLGRMSFMYNNMLPRWWRIEYSINPTDDGYYRSRILELGLRDELTPALPSTGSTISKIYPTTNLKDIYVWTRLIKSGVAYPTITYLYEQVNIKSTFDSDALNKNDILNIFDGSTSTSQQGLHGFNVTSATDSNAKVRFDYEFHEPTEVMEIVFTDGNDQTNGRQGGISSMSIYNSITGGKNDNEWKLHSNFVNLNNPYVISDPNTNSVGWDEKYTPKGLKIIQYDKSTKSWIFKGIYQIPP